jgi:hypothetical protein
MQRLSVTCVGGPSAAFFLGECSLYLLYLDESGQHHGRKTKYFVMGGLAVHEEDCYPFGRSVEAVMRRSLPLPDAELELHASPVWAGRNEWARVSRTNRHRLIDRVFDHLATWKAPSTRAPIYFGVAIHKASFPGRNIIELAHEEIFGRFDIFVNRLHLSGDSHRSLVIADQSSYGKLVQGMLPQWKVAGTTRGGRLHSFVEVPLYVDSDASRIVQVADCVSWAIFNYYERGHTNYMQQINGRFDGDSGVQHGMVHLIRGYTSCLCVACTSRRTHVVEVTVPAVITP